MDFSFSCKTRSKQILGEYRKKQVTYQKMKAKKRYLHELQITKGAKEEDFRIKDLKTRDQIRAAIREGMYEEACDLLSIEADELDADFNYQDLECYTSNRSTLSTFGDFIDKETCVTEKTPGECLLHVPDYDLPMPPEIQKAVEDLTFLSKCEHFSFVDDLDYEDYLTKERNKNAVNSIVGNIPKNNEDYTAVYTEAIERVTYFMTQFKNYYNETIELLPDIPQDEMLEQFAYFAALSRTPLPKNFYNELPDFKFYWKIREIDPHIALVRFNSAISRRPHQFNKLFNEEQQLPYLKRLSPNNSFWGDSLLVYQHIRNFYTHRNELCYMPFAFSKWIYYDLENEAYHRELVRSIERNRPLTEYETYQVLSNVADGKSTNTLFEAIRLDNYGMFKNELLNIIKQTKVDRDREQAFNEERIRLMDCIIFKALKQASRSKEIFRRFVMDPMFMDPEHFKAQGVGDLIKQLLMDSAKDIFDSFKEILEENIIMIGKEVIAFIALMLTAFRSTTIETTIYAAMIYLSTSHLCEVAVGTILKIVFTQYQKHIKKQNTDQADTMEGQGDDDMSNAFTLFVPIFQNILKPKKLQDLKIEKEQIAIFRNAMHLVTDIPSGINVLTKFITTSLDFAYEKCTGTKRVPPQIKEIMKDIDSVMVKAKEIQEKNLANNMTHRDVRDMVEEITASIASIEKRLIHSEMNKHSCLQPFYAMASKWAKVSENLIMYKMCGQKRIEPIWVHITGNRGTGKTTVCEIITASVMAHYGMDYRPGDLWSKARGSDYMDGYVGQIACLFDEVWSKRGTTEDSENVAVADELFAMVNTNPYHMNMSQTEDKKGVYFKSAMVFSTGNATGIPSSIPLNNLDALRDRCFLFLRATRKSGETRDFQKKRPPLNLNDWTFTEYKFEGNQYKDKRTYTFQEVVDKIIEGLENTVDVVMNYHKLIREIREKTVPVLDSKFMKYMKTYGTADYETTFVAQMQGSDGVPLSYYINPEKIAKLELIFKGEKVIKPENSNNEYVSEAFFKHILKYVSEFPISDREFHAVQQKVFKVISLKEENIVLGKYCIKSEPLRSLNLDQRVLWIMVFLYMNDYVMYNKIFDELNTNRNLVVPDFKHINDFVTGDTIRKHNRDELRSKIAVGDFNTKNIDMENLLVLYYTAATRRTVGLFGRTMNWFYNKTGYGKTPLDYFNDALGDFCKSYENLMAVAGFELIVRTVSFITAVIGIIKLGQYLYRYLTAPEVEIQSEIVKKKVQIKGSERKFVKPKPINQVTAHFGKDKQALAITKSIKENLMKFDFKEKTLGDMATGYGIFVKGTTFATVRHIYNCMDKTSDVIIYVRNKQYVVPHSNIQIYTTEERDIIFISLHTKELQPFPDISRHFCKDRTFEYDLGCLHLVNVDDTQYGCGFKFVGPRFYTLDNEQISNICTIEGEGHTQAGDCGTVGIVENEQIEDKIVGLVVGGGNGHTLLTPILEDDCKNLPTNYKAQGFYANIEIPPNITTLINPIKPSSLTRLPGRSREEATVFQEIWEPLKYPVSFSRETKAVYRALGKYREAHILRGHDEAWEFVTNFMANRYKNRLKGVEMRTLTDYEAHNGVKGWKHVNGRIDLSLNVSYDFRTRNFLPPRIALYQNNYPIPKFEDEVKRLEKELFNEKPDISNYRTKINLKQERRKEGKAPRIYNNPPESWLIIGRKYFGSFVESVMRSTSLGPTLGCNPKSVEHMTSFWTLLTKFARGRGREYFDQVMDMVCAGDFQAFDATCDDDERDSFNVMIDLFYINQTEQEKILRRNYIHLLDRITKVISNVELFPGTTVSENIPGQDLGVDSGDFLTAVRQSWNCEFNIRRAFYDIMKQHNFTTEKIQNYMEELEILSHGDDHLFTFFVELFDIFNMKTLQKQLLCYGKNYTDDKKSVEIPPSVKINEATYLKRFILSTFDNLWETPYVQFALDKDVIRDMVCWCEKNKFQTKERALSNNVFSALNEASYWGKEYYDYFYNKCVEVFSKYGQFELPVYNYKEWVRKSRDTIFKAQMYGGGKEGLTDRQMVTNPVHTTVNQLIAVDSNVGHNDPNANTNYPIAPPNMHTDPYDTDDQHDFLKRRYFIKQVQVTSEETAGTEITTLSFPNDLMVIPNIARKVTNYQYLKAGIRVTVTINTSPFALGSVMITELAHAGDWNTGHELRKPFANIWTASSLNNVILSFSQNTSVSFVIPYVAPSNYWNMSDDPNGIALNWMGAVSFWVLTPLRIINQTTTAEATLTIYAEFVAPELAGPSLRTNVWTRDAKQLDNLRGRIRSEYHAQMKHGETCPCPNCSKDTDGDATFTTNPREIYYNKVFPTLIPAQRTIHEGFEMGEKITTWKDYFSRFSHFADIGTEVGVFTANPFSLQDSMESSLYLTQWKTFVYRFKFFRGKYRWQFIPYYSGKSYLSTTLSTFANWRGDPVNGKHYHGGFDNPLFVDGVEVAYYSQYPYYCDAYLQEIQNSHNYSVYTPTHLQVNFNNVNGSDLPSGTIVAVAVGDDFSHGYIMPPMWQKYATTFKAQMKRGPPVVVNDKLSNYMPKEEKAAEPIIEKQDAPPEKAPPQQDAAVEAPKMPQKIEQAEMSEKSSISGIFAGAAGFLGRVGKFMWDAKNSMTWLYHGFKSLGFDSPTSVTNFQEMSLQNFRLVHQKGVWNGITMAADPTNAVTKDMSIFGTKMDYGQIAVCARTPSLLDTQQISTTMTPGTVFWYIPVNPKICVSSTVDDISTYYPTHLADTADKFSYWRGSIDFLINIYSSSMQNFRFAIVHDIGFSLLGVSSVNLNDLGNLVTHVYDCAGDTQIRVKIPYLRPEAWLPIASYYNTNTADASLRTIGSNGALAFVVVSPVASIAVGDTTGFGMVTFIGGGEDCEFAVPTGIAQGYYSDVGATRQKRKPKPVEQLTTRSTQVVEKTSAFFEKEKTLRIDLNNNNYSITKQAQR